MKIHSLIIPLVIALTLFGCSDKNFTANDILPKAETTDIPDGAQQGVLRIKLKEHYSQSLLQELGTKYTVQRTFPEAGKFESRHREAGLDLWYDVFFDKDIPLTKATKSVEELDGIAIIDYVYPLHKKSLPFNDPYFSNQWNFYNTGSNVSGGVAGVDINVLKAWEVETGRPDVIVAINDVAPDPSHQDLKKNMWVNVAEFNGLDGVDDDGNGYVDDIYGYNFLSFDNKNSHGVLQYEDYHGTHVAGIIAAVNNNGLGVTGIAGGNGKPNTGVRIMATQVLGSSEAKSFTEKSIVYAADNGAVLMNCSWSFDENVQMPYYLKDAIDYFNNNAGLNEYGKQVGPMKGGLIIFAAGNENRERAYPAMSSNVFAVASITADYTKAYYSNYGDWVDLCAPGGDTRQDQGIYSLIPQNSYSYLQGTSMAAPHVTGVAALIVSKYGKEGFTRNDLLKILRSSANKSVYDYNPIYKSYLGEGLVDAAQAVNYTNEIPEKIVAPEIKSNANNIIITWPELPQGKQAFSHTIYYSEKPFSTKDLNVLKSEGQVVEVISSDSGVVEGLKFTTQYYLRVVAQNVYGEMSELSDQFTCVTGHNTPPSVEVLSETNFTMKSHEKRTLKIKVTDPDGHMISFKAHVKNHKNAINGLSSYILNDTIFMNINAVQLEEGFIYDGYIEISDSYASVNVPLYFEILPNHAPVLVSPIPDVIINEIGGETSFILTDYFTDEDGEELSFTFEDLQTQRGSHSLSPEGFLVLSAESYGSSILKVSAKDARGETATCQFNVLVRDGNNDLDLYPNPVTDILNIRTPVYNYYDLTIMNRLGAVVYETNAEVEIGPFIPLTVDLSFLPTGVYYVKLSGIYYDNNYSIIKR